MVYQLIDDEHYPFERDLLVELLLELWTPRGI
jgi:hypothetical protein